MGHCTPTCVYAILVIAVLLSNIEAANVQINSSLVSISGISSGAAFTVQYQTTYSSQLIGAGVFAGPPFYAAQGSLETALECIVDPNLINIAVLENITRNWAANGLIDDVSNLKNHALYLFSGKLDVVVDPVAVFLLEQMERDLGVTRIHTEYNIYAAHGQPTMDYGLPCYVLFPPFILDCKYDGAGEALKWIYANYITQPAGKAISTNMLTIDITQFIPTGSTVASLSFANPWYAYVPQACKSQKCALHIAIHGCLSGGALVGLTFRDHAGYNEWAESNNIVILYPQVVESVVDPINPQGCWDWWGYTDQNYSNNHGLQLQTVNTVVTYIVSGAWNGQ